MIDVRLKIDGNWAAHNWTFAFATSKSTDVIACLYVPQATLVTALPRPCYGLTCQNLTYILHGSRYAYSHHTRSRPGQSTHECVSSAAILLSWRCSQITVGLTNFHCEKMVKQIVAQLGYVFFFSKDLIVPLFSAFYRTNSADIRIDLIRWYSSNRPHRLYRSKC